MDNSKLMGELTAPAAHDVELWKVGNMRNLCNGCTVIESLLFKSKECMTCNYRHPDTCRVCQQDKHSRDTIQHPSYTGARVQYVSMDNLDNTNVVYAKSVTTSDHDFSGRMTTIVSGNCATIIPIPDNIVLCNGCNSNIHETESKQGYMIYLTKNDLRANRPYDVYCGECLKRYFPKAQLVDASYTHKAYSEHNWCGAEWDTENRFSKTHYEIISRALLHVKDNEIPSIVSGYGEQTPHTHTYMTNAVLSYHESIVHHLIDILKHDNKRFDADRFWYACTGRPVDKSVCDTCLHKHFTSEYFEDLDKSKWECDLHNSIIDCCDFVDNLDAIPSSPF